MREHLEQLTDPALICKHAVWHLGDRRSLGSTLGLAAFHTPCPGADVSQAQPGVWAAFCHATRVVERLSKDRWHPGTWSAMWRTNTEREELLRDAATWIHEHSGVVVEDNEVQVIHDSPGRYVGKIKDPKLSYLGPFGKETPEEALADAHQLIQRVRDREAFEAGDDSFEEVIVKTCGVTSSFVRRKETVSESV